MTCRSVFRLLAWGLPFFGAGAQGFDISSDLEMRVQEILQDRSSAIVRVEALDKHGRLVGTGFFADPSGTIYTVYSTVGDAQEVWILRGDERLPASVLLADRRSGVALLKVDRATPFLPLARPGSLALATPVVAIGFPHDLPLTPSFGIVGGFDRKFLGKFFVTTHVRANVPVQPGFGGAPLLNLRGEVVGMVVAGINGGASCFALPIEAAEKIRRDYVRFGEARHGWVGVMVEGFPNAEVRVAELGPETPAAQSGLREGDILLQVGAVAIKEVEDVLDASFFLTDGDPVGIRVRRQGTELFFSIPSIAHPSCGRATDMETVATSSGFNLQP